MDKPIALVNPSGQPGITNREKLGKVQDLNNKDIARDIELKKKAKELESLFLTQLLKTMEKTLPADAMGGSENNMASMMFSNVMADSISDQGGMGLSDMLYQSLKEKDAEGVELPGRNDNVFMDNMNAIYRTMLEGDK